MRSRHNRVPGAALLGRHVSIAFRRSVRSRPEQSVIGIHKRESPLPFGVQCVPDMKLPKVTEVVRNESPLPFGVQCVPDRLKAQNTLSQGHASPLPFGVQCVPDYDKG